MIPAATLGQWNAHNTPDIVLSCYLEITHDFQTEMPQIENRVAITQELLYKAGWCIDLTEDV